MLKIVLSICILMILVSPCAAERTISTLPAYEDFEDASGDTSEYADILWTDGGATATHQGGGGWDGGDCVRFTTPTSTSSRATTGQWLGLPSPTKICARYLVRIPSSMLTHLASVQEPKMAIFNRATDQADQRLIYWWNYCSESTSDPYPMQVTGHNNTQLVPPACTSYGSYPVSLTGPDWICSLQGNGALPDFSWDDWVNAWVSVEVCADIASGATADGSLKVMVTTQDGTYNNTVILQPACGMDNRGTSTWSYIDGLGMIVGGGGSASYFDMDDIVIDDEEIGPPAGFVTGGDTTAPTLSNASPSGEQSCSSNPRTVTLSVDCSDAVGCTACSADTSNIDIDAMSISLSQSGSTWSGTSGSHACGTSPTYYAKCEDAADNESGATTISFSVASELSGSPKTYNAGAGAMTVGGSTPLTYVAP